MEEVIKVAVKHLNLIAGRWEDLAVSYEDDEQLSKLLLSDADNLRLLAKLLKGVLDSGQTTEAEPQIACKWDRVH